MSGKTGKLAIVVGLIVLSVALATGAIVSVKRAAYQDKLDAMHREFDQGKRTRAEARKFFGSVVDLWPEPSNASH